MANPKGTLEDASRRKPLPDAYIVMALFSYGPFRAPWDRDLSPMPIYLWPV